MSNRSATENTPLLEPEVASPGVGNRLANRAVAFRIVTTASLVAGVLTLIFLVVCVGLLSRAPQMYYPPYPMYYNFAPAAGSVRRR